MGLQKVGKLGVTLIFFTLTLTPALISAIYVHSPVIRIKNGLIQGSTHYSRNGRPYYRFLGVPYAKPPIDSLRFQPPEPPSDWNGTFVATIPSAFCLCHEFFFLDETIGDESCLYLNVMSPAEVLPSPNSTKLYPVIVFIHGGLFHDGNSFNYRGKFFMDEEIVLVTIQYRLGMFGFLSTNDEAIPGNMGLKDQVMALRWVQENIKHFGGDPNQVTIMGESSGGTSVHYLMLSPLAKGLFHRAISMSGDSLFETYPWERNVTKQMEYVADYFKCPRRNTTAFAKCMRELPLGILISLRISAKDMDYLHHPAYFPPVVEPDIPGAFLTDKPISLLRSGKVASKVAWINGFNENEGLFILSKALQFSKDLEIVKNETLWNEVVHKLLFYNPKLRPDAAEKIRTHFFGNSSSDLTTRKAAGILSGMITEKLHFKPALESSLLQSKVAPVYMYCYTYHAYISTFNFLRWAKADEGLIAKSVKTGYQFAKDFYKRFISPNWRQYHHFGVSHGDEIFLLFDITFATQVFTDVLEFDMSRLFMRAIIDFAHAVEPLRFNGLEWPQVKPNETVQIMNFNVGEPKILVNPFEERLKFWDELNLPSP